jgi:hypothetical protein
MKHQPFIANEEEGRITVEWTGHRPTAADENGCSLKTKLYTNYYDQQNSGESWINI